MTMVSFHGFPPRLRINSIRQYFSDTGNFVCNLSCSYSSETVENSQESQDSGVQTTNQEGKNEVESSQDGKEYINSIEGGANVTPVDQPVGDGRTKEYFYSLIFLKYYQYYCIA